MQSDNDTFTIGFFLQAELLLCIAAAFAFGLLFDADARRALGKWRSIGLVVGVSIVGTLVSAWRSTTIMQVHVWNTVYQPNNPVPVASTSYRPDVMMAVVQLLATSTAVALVMLLATKLIQKFASGRLTEAERQPGRVGIVTWLSPRHCMIALAIGFCSICALWGPEQEADQAMWIGLLLTLIPFVAFLAYPLARTIWAMPPRERPAATSPQIPERDRVLRLLEQERITADEAAELLGALASIAPGSSEVATPWTVSRKLMLCGAALVLAGFFLPWFSINLSHEMHWLTGSLVGQVPASYPPFGAGTSVSVNGQTVLWPPANVPLESVVMTVYGGDIEHGLGWLVLGMSLVAAMLPYIATGLPRHTQRTVMWLATGSASVIAFYLLTREVSVVSWGLPIVLIGLGIEVLGLFKELPQSAGVERHNAAGFEAPEVV